MRRRQPHGSSHMPTQPADEAAPDWPLQDNLPWPGDEPASDPRPPLVVREQEKSDVMGERFARIATGILLSFGIFCILAIMGTLTLLFVLWLLDFL